MKNIRDIMIKPKEQECNFLPVDLFSIDREFGTETMKKIVLDNRDIIFLAGILKNEEKNETRYSLMRRMPKLFPVQIGSICASPSTVYPLLNSLQKREYVSDEENPNGGRQRKILNVLPKGEDYLINSFAALCELMNFYRDEYMMPTLKGRGRSVQKWLKKTHNEHTKSSMDAITYSGSEKMNFMNQYIQSNLDFLVLSSLSDHKNYGYCISKEINENFKTNVKLPRFYQSLLPMEKRDLVKFNWEHPENTKPRKTYGITSMGEKYRDAYMNSLIRLGNYIANPCVDILVERILKKKGMTSEKIKEMGIDPLLIAKLY
jgi:DNA-binding PadR family transcriptional regulator